MASSGSCRLTSTTWPIGAAAFACQQRGHRRHGAVRAGGFVGQRDRRQHRRTAVHALEPGIAGHRLGQRAEPGTRGVRPRLAEAADAGDDQPGVGLQQPVGAQPPPLEGAGPEALHQHVAARGEPQAQLGAAVAGQVEGDGQLVAGQGLPPQRVPVDRPAHLACRVAVHRVLDLDDLGAEVAQVAGEDRAGDDRGQVQDPEPLQGCAHPSG
jgi:hypothetical protein